MSLWSPDPSRLHRPNRPDIKEVKGNTHPRVRKLFVIMFKELLACRDHGEIKVDGHLEQGLKCAQKENAHEGPLAGQLCEQNQKVCPRRSLSKSTRMNNVVRQQCDAFGCSCVSESAPGRARKKRNGGAQAWPLISRVSEVGYVRYHRQWL